MRSFVPVATAALVAGAILGAARASQAAAPVNGPAAIKSLRSTADYYRSLTWTYQAAAKHPRTRSSLSYRRSRDGAYLRWTVAVWQGNAARARRTALAVLHKRLGITLPADPGRHASLASRIAYDQRVTTKLQGLARAAKRTDRSLASASVRVNEYELRQWQTRVAHSLLDVSRHVTRMSLAGPVWLTGAFLCIHHFEGAWNDDTGNGYYGGLQMSRTFMERYGADFLRRYGTADRWPPWAQVQASVRAYQSGRGFWPWPRTAADCGLL